MGSFLLASPCFPSVGGECFPGQEGRLSLAAVFQDNSRRQKQLLTQRFEALCAVLEERKAELLQALAREQEQKLQRVRGLIRQYGDHLEASSKLVESAIQSMEEPQMALYLQVGPAGGRQAAEGLRCGGLGTWRAGPQSYLWHPFAPLCLWASPPRLSPLAPRRIGISIPAYPAGLWAPDAGLRQRLARCLRSPSFFPCSRPRS